MSDAWQWHRSSPSQSSVDHLFLYHHGPCPAAAFVENSTVSLHPSEKTVEKLAWLPHSVICELLPVICARHGDRKPAEAARLRLSASHQASIRAHFFDALPAS